MTVASVAVPLPLSQAPAHSDSPLIVGAASVIATRWMETRAKGLPGCVLDVEGASLEDAPGEHSV